MSEVSVVNSSGMLSTAKLRGDSIVRCIRGLRVEGTVGREGAPAVFDFFFCKVDIFVGPRVFSGISQSKRLRDAPDCYTRDAHAE